MSSGNLAREITSSRNRHFSPWNVFSALLLVADEGTLSMARRVMESFGISVFAAASVLEAERILRNTRLDLAICDFDMPCAPDLSLLQPSSHWRGLSIGLMPTARFDYASHKRLQIRIPKPVSVDMLVRSLKASYTNMAQHRIAAYRHTCPSNSFWDAGASGLAAYTAAGERAQRKPNRPLPECLRASASRGRYQHEPDAA